MTARSDPAAAPLELTVARLVDAPPALVFAAWTSAQHAARWWGPQGFTVVSCRLDARPGGTYRVAMRSPEGRLHTKRGTYQEVVAPERLVFSYAWEDEHGQPGHTMRVTVTFQPQAAKTLLTLHQTGFATEAACDSHRGGWTSCFERFTDYATTLASSVPSPSGGGIPQGGSHAASDRVP